MPEAASTSAAGPTLGMSANAEPSSPKPITPRVRWAVIEARARAPGVSLRALRVWSSMTFRSGAKRMTPALVSHLGGG